MADLGYHGVGTVGITLSKPSRMNMYVRNNHTSSLPAMCPKFSKSATIDIDYTGSQGIRINVVIENKLLNLP